MNVRNPQWTTEREGYINCEIEHPVYGWIPFTASCHDEEEHGRQIYQAILNGEHGDISNCPYEEYENSFISQKNAAISALNVFCSNPLNWMNLTAEQQAEALACRQQLTDLAFSDAHLFPTKPDWLI